MKKISDIPELDRPREKLQGLWGQVLNYQIIYRAKLKVLQADSMLPALPALAASHSTGSDRGMPLPHNS